MNPMKLAATITVGVAAMAVGALISTAVFCVALGHALWEGQLD